MESLQTMSLIHKCVKERESVKCLGIDDLSQVKERLGNAVLKNTNCLLREIRDLSRHFRETAPQHNFVITL